MHHWFFWLWFAYQTVRASREANTEPSGVVHLLAGASENTAVRVAIAFAPAVGEAIRVWGPMAQQHVLALPAPPGPAQLRAWEPKVEVTQKTVKPVEEDRLQELYEDQQGLAHLTIKELRWMCKAYGFKGAAQTKDLMVEQIKKYWWDYEATNGAVPTGASDTSESSGSHSESESEQGDVPAGDDQQSVAARVEEKLQEERAAKSAALAEQNAESPALGDVLGAASEAEHEARTEEETGGEEDQVQTQREPEKPTGINVPQGSGGQRERDSTEERTTPEERQRTEQRQEKDTGGTNDPLGTGVKMVEVGTAVLAAMGALCAAYVAWKHADVVGWVIVMVAVCVAGWKGMAWWRRSEEEREQRVMRRLEEKFAAAQQREKERNQSTEEKRLASAEAKGTSEETEENRKLRKRLQAMEEMQRRTEAERLRTEEEARRTKELTAQVQAEDAARAEEARKKRQQERDERNRKRDEAKEEKARQRAEREAQRTKEMEEREKERAKKQEEGTKREEQQPQEAARSHELQKLQQRVAELTGATPSSGKGVNFEDGFKFLSLGEHSKMTGDPTEGLGQTPRCDVAGDVPIDLPSTSGDSAGGVDPAAMAAMVRSEVQVKVAEGIQEALKGMLPQAQAATPEHKRDEASSGSDTDSSGDENDQAFGLSLRARKKMRKRLRKKTITKYRQPTKGSPSILSKWALSKAEEMGCVVQEDPGQPLGDPTPEAEYRAQFFLNNVWASIEVDTASSALKAKVRAARTALGGKIASPTQVLHDAVVGYRKTHETSRGWTAEIHAIAKQGPSEAPSAYFKRFQRVLDTHGVVDIPSSVIELLKEGSTGELERQLISSTILSDITWADCGVIAAKVKHGSQGQGVDTAYQAHQRGQQQWVDKSKGKGKKKEKRGHPKGIPPELRNKCFRCAGDHLLTNCQVPASVTCTYCTGQGRKGVGHLVHACQFKMWDAKGKAGQHRGTDDAHVWFGHGDDDDAFVSCTEVANGDAEDLGVEADQGLGSYMYGETGMGKSAQELAAIAQEASSADDYNRAPDVAGAVRLRRGQAPLPDSDQNRPRKQAQRTPSSHPAESVVDSANTCECCHGGHVDLAPRLEMGEPVTELEPFSIMNMIAVAMLPLAALLASGPRLVWECLLQVPPIAYVVGTWRQAKRRALEITQQMRIGRDAQGSRVMRKWTRRLFVIYGLYFLATKVVATGATGGEVHVRWRTRFAPWPTGVQEIGDTGPRASFEVEKRTAPTDPKHDGHTDAPWAADSAAMAGSDGEPSGDEGENVGQNEIVSQWKLDTGATRSILADGGLCSLGQLFPTHVIFSGFAGQKTTASQATVCLPTRFTPNGRTAALRCEYVPGANANLLSPWDLLAIDPLAKLDLWGVLTVFQMPLQIACGRTYVVRLHHPASGDDVAAYADDHACVADEADEQPGDEPPADNACGKGVGLAEHINSMHTLPLKKGVFCPHCCQAKLTVCPRGTQLELAPEWTEAAAFGDIVHCDAIGPVRTSAGGHKHVMHLVDGATRWGEALPVQSLSHAHMALEFWIKTNRCPKAVHCDMARYFTGGRFAALCAANNIQMLFSTPYLHRMNGLVERRHRTLSSNVRAAISSSGGRLPPLPVSDWHLCVPYISYAMNRAPHRGLGGQSPFRARYGRETRARLLRWGQLVFVANEHSGEGQKFDPGHKGLEGRLMGICPWSHSYLVAVKGKGLLKSRSVKPRGDDVPGWAGAAGPSPVDANLASDGEWDFGRDEILAAVENVAAREESANAAQHVGENWTDRKVPTKHAGDIAKIAEKTEKAVEKLLAPAASGAEPAAGAADDLADLAPEDAEVVRKWREACRKEVQKHLDHDVFEPCTAEEARASGPVLTCRMLSDVKRCGRYKCRVVCSGQHDGLKTPAYTACLSLVALRVVVALASILGGHFVSFDANSAFLQATYGPVAYCRLDDVLYAAVGHRFCRIRKCLNGLVHSPKYWGLHRDDALRGLGFTPIAAGVWAKGAAVMVVYVDDFLVWCPTPEQAHQVVKEVSAKLSSDVAGELRPGRAGDTLDFLGLHLHGRAEGGVDIEMHSYTEKCVSVWEEVMKKETGAEPVARKCPTHSPMDPAAQRAIVSAKEGDPPATPAARATRPLATRQRLLGLLQYLACGCRPDLAAATGILACGATADIDLPFQKVFRFLRKRTKLVFPGKPAGAAGTEKTQLKIESFTDADLGNSRSAKSRSGYAIRLNGATVAWRSTQVATVALSTTESELAGATDACRATEEVAALVGDLAASWEAMDGFQLAGTWKVFSKYDQLAVSNEDQETPVPGALVPILHTDNESLCHLVCGHREAMRLRHLRLRLAYLRQVHDLKGVQLSWLPGEQNVADIFTKAVTLCLFQRFSKALGLVEDPLEERASA